MPFLNPTRAFLFRGMIFSLCCLLLFSCQEENHAQAKKEQQEKKALVFSQAINFPKKQDIHLSPNAKKATAQWLAFITARAEIKRFEQFTIQEAANNAATVQQIMTALQETVPEVFRTKPVLARLNVLATLSNVLKQTASNPNATAAEIEATAKKIPVAFENLKIQLNEVFRKSLEEFELELDQKTDSLRTQTLTDTLFLPTPN